MGLLTAAAGSFPAGPVVAADAGRTPPCLSVEVDGHAANSPDCMAFRLEQAGRVAQDRARAPIALPVVDASSPDVRTGVANQTATRQRMGNTFGTSVHPQRPDRFAPAPRP